MKKLVIALSLITLSAPAFAADGVEFATADADASGTVTLTEVQAVLPDLTDDEFMAADVDGNGELTPEEFTTLPGAMMAN